MQKNQKTMVYVLIGAFIIILGFSFFVGTEDTNNNTKNNGKYEISEEPNKILENAQNESKKVKEEEQKELTEINIDKYLEYYQGSENKIILIARPTCSYCQIAEPIIRKIAKEKDLEINYLNTDNFENDDEAKLVKSDEFFNEGFGTPLLLIVKDNKIVDKIDGLTDTAHYTEFFKTYGFIK
ncbi:MAG: hypothetical protein HFJ11_06810 [Bacilli bacterium]|nr:hypothetical protein [Bacilli bacterium]